MLRVLIVEDDNKIQEQIEKTIHQIGQNFKTLVAHNIKMALMLAESFAIDIFILDVALPDGNGLDLAKRLRVTYPNQPMIIESTEQDLSYQKRVHDEIENLAFLEKPYPWEKLKRKVSRAADIAKSLATKKLVIEQNGLSYFFEINDILYIETIKGAKMIEIVSYDREVENLKKVRFRDVPLSKLMENLPDKNTLIRCHNSYIVNPKMMTKWNHSSLQGNSIVLKYQNIEVPIGRTYRNKISALI